MPAHRRRISSPAYLHFTPTRCCLAGPVKCRAASWSPLRMGTRGRGLSATRVQKHEQQSGYPGDGVQPRTVPQAARPYPFTQQRANLSSGWRNVWERQSRSPSATAFLGFAARVICRFPVQGTVPLPDAGPWGHLQAPNGPEGPAWPPPTAPFKLQPRP